jgi:nucleoporin NUP159
VEGTGKPFSDLLKTPDKAEEPTKPAQRSSVFSLPNPNKDEPLETPTKVSPASSTIFSLANLTPPPDLTSLGPGTPSSDVEHPSGDDFSEDGSSQQSGEERGEEGEEDEYGEDTEEYGSDSESGSFLDESLSYEDIGAHLDEEELEGPHELSPVAEETTLPLESGDEGDTTQSPRKKRPTPDPTKIALPVSRESSVQPDTKSSGSGSPSVTPRPTTAELPPPGTASAQQSREPSTTPPSTPAKPNPTLPTPSTSSYGIGLGRPSAKPTRSSPLTGDPISGQGTAKQPLSAVTPLLPKPRPASPKVAFGQWDKPESRNKKPDLSKIQPFSLETPFTKVTSEPAKTPLFGAPPTPGATPSLFGKPGDPLTPNLGTAFTPTQPTPGSGVFGERDNANTFNQPTEGAVTSGGFFGKPTAEGSFPPKEATRTPRLPNRLLSVPSATPTPDAPVKAAFLAISTKQSPAAPPVVTPPKPVQLGIPEPSPADGLQAECLYLYLTMNKDIEEVSYHLFSRIPK